MPEDEQQDEQDEPSGWVKPAAEATANVVTWLATMASVELGGGATAASPAVRAGAEAAYSSLSKRWQHLSRRGGTQVLEEAASAGKTPVDELEARIASTEQRVLLAGMALEAGTRTVDEDKLRALGRALAAGAADDALVDPAVLIVLALADLEPPHVQLLRQMAEETPPRIYAGGRIRYVTSPPPFRPSAWEHRQMVAAAPGLQAVLGPVLATLTRHALIAQVDHTSKALKDLSNEMSQRARSRSSEVSWQPLRTSVPTPSWRITDFGLEVVALLRRTDAADG